ncbi:MAG: ATP-grasp domain-containing protein [Usitatibacter sp.]
MTKDVLVVCATHRDRRELAKIAPDLGLRLHFHDYASLQLENLAGSLSGDNSIESPYREIADLVERFSGSGLHAVISTDDYPGSVIAAVVAKRLGLPGISPVASLRCQHKYLCRLDQQRLVPQAAVKFSLVDSRAPTLRVLDYPVFVKPVKSFFSIGASRVDSPAQFPAAVRNATLPEPFYRPFDELLRLHPELGLAEVGSHCVLAEALLIGHQCTLEGYVRRGSAHTLGVVDSIFYPGTQAFQRFEYPSSLPSAVQARLHRIAADLMEGIGYGEGFFNVEFMVDLERETAHIIEVNPRLASQFADLYEKVDGTNSYRMLLDIALGRPPSGKRRGGRHRMAASCALRRFEDAYVAGLPSDRSIERLRARYPEVRVEILATKGEWLSQCMQDGCSFRYAIVSIGGGDRADILGILEDCVAELRFEFQEHAIPGASMERPEVRSPPGDPPAAAFRLSGFSDSGRGIPSR